MAGGILRIAPKVLQALSEGKPLVALESTIITHGMPYPANLKTAIEVEDVVEEAGAMPATIAIMEGKPVVGLSRKEIEFLSKSDR